MNTISDKQNLITAIETGYTPKWLLFWGHRHSKDGSLGKTCFSQWWDGHPFAVNGIIYRTAEHFMMAEKARLFGDADACARILLAASPAEAKKLGRQVKGFSDEAWLAARWDIVVRSNEAKFSQHADLRNFLLRTGDSILVEASPFDQIWGIGMAATQANAEDPKQWKGLNLLGFALMEVRRRLAVGPADL